MKAADAIAVDLAAGSSVIDDMETAALHGSPSPTRKFLAAYQAKLASGTSRGMDLQFITHLVTYQNRKGMKN